MKTILASFIAALVLSAACGPATAGMRREEVRFGKGAVETTINGRIKGHDYVDYLLSARKGATLTITFAPSNLATYFNLLPPGSESALFIGSTSGNSFTGGLPSDGTYTIRVYLIRSAARRKESSRYTLKVSLKETEQPSAAPAPAGGTPFNRTLELQGIRFHVTCPNAGSLNTLTIVPSGLEIINEPIVKAIDGTVTGAEVADLNADGAPEIYVYVTSVGSGSYGSLVAYAANRRKSLSEIYLPPITSIPMVAEGYQGHDEFAMLEGRLGRRFPLYRGNDTNASPTGGMRQLQYRLVPGEAGWSLTVDRVVEY